LKTIWEHKKKKRKVDHHYHTKIESFAIITYKNQSWKNWKIIWLPCWIFKKYCSKMLKYKKIMYVLSTHFDCIHISYTHNLPCFPCYSTHPMFTHNQRHDLHSNKAKTPNLTFSTSWNKFSHLQAFLPQFQSIISCLEHDCYHAFLFVILKFLLL
jgi:hypothetical protein